MPTRKKLKEFEAVHAWIDALPGGVPKVPGETLLQRLQWQLRKNICPEDYMLKDDNPWGRWGMAPHPEDFEKGGIADDTNDFIPTTTYDHLHRKHYPSVDTSPLEVAPDPNWIARHLEQSRAENLSETPCVVQVRED